VGEERHVPYDRPPLSKQVLAGKWEPERIRLPATEDAALDLDLQLGRRAVALDMAGREVEVDSGERLAFDGLVIATGTTPRTLPGTEDLGGVHTLRTLDDCLAVRATLDATPGRVVVVGAGFIGAEVAATCHERGIEVTLLEALPVPLGRVLGDEIGGVCGEIHRDHGVDLRVGVGVDAMEGGERVERVRLSDGSAVDADLVVVGVGVVPTTDWLAGSGLTIDNGVLCDETCLAAPGIVAAGDVARWPNRRFDEVMRVEHWDNAIEQGAHAAKRLLAGDTDAGREMAYEPVPWFWSDQYDAKIQLAGRSMPHDEVRVVQGSTDERRFVAAYRRGDRIIGILGFGRPRAVMDGRRLIEARASWADAISALEA
jgi:NADPH-dependent 2,4-dienoyl-CoA reductase/sulfur reductase-like enzyme